MKRLTVKKIDEIIGVLDSLEAVNDERADYFKTVAATYLRNYADRLDYVGKKSVKTKE